MPTSSAMLYILQKSNSNLAFPQIPIWSSLTCIIHAIRWHNNHKNYHLGCCSALADIWFSVWPHLFEEPSKSGERRWARWDCLEPAGVWRPGSGTVQVRTWRVRPAHHAPASQYTARTSAKMLGSGDGAVKCGSLVCYVWYCRMSDAWLSFRN